jgi:outer membrane protein OmpA-like peptidoglycan-associated protein
MRLRPTNGLSGILIAAALLAFGCASTPRVAPQEVSDAQMALQDARSAGAETLAAEPYNAASAHLSLAQNTWRQNHDLELSAHYARLAESEARDAQYRARARRSREEIENQTRRKAQLEIAVRDAEIRVIASRAQSEAERQRLEAEARGRVERARVEAELAQREQDRQASEAREKALVAQLETERQKTVELQRQAELDRLKTELETERKGAEEARRAADNERRNLETLRKQEEERRSGAEQLATAQSGLLERLQKIERSTRQESRGIVLTLPGSVYFATGRSDVLPGVRDRVAEIGKALANVPDKHILIEGHTDSTGRAELNLRLSELRAESIKAVLVAGGVAPDRIEIHGYGATKPVAANTTPSGRAQNRRVEIIVQGQSRM